MSLKLGEPFRHLMPSLSAAGYTDLKADVQMNGLNSPIAVDEERNILDGHHRYRICLELGIEPQIMTIRDLGSDQAKHAWIYRVNLNRRSLTAAEKKAITQKQKATALALFAAGRGIREVTRLTGKPYETVRGWIKAGAGDRISQPAQASETTQHELLPESVVVDAAADKVPRLTDQEQKTAALRMLGEGKNLSYVARELGRSLSTIRLWRDSPEQKAGRDHLKVNDEKVRQLWDKGTDRSGIAKALGISVGAVTASFKRLGIGRGGRLAKNPLINYLQRATAEADIWTDCESPILAAARQASLQQLDELSKELGRLSRTAAQLKRRLEDAARKRVSHGQEAREAEGSRYRH